MNLRKLVTKDRLRRPPLRVQLTVLYPGLFLFLVAAVLAVCTSAWVSTGPTMSSASWEGRSTIYSAASRPRSNHGATS